MANKRALNLINQIATRRGAIQGTTFIAPPTYAQHLITVSGLHYYLTPDQFVAMPLAVWRVSGDTSVFERGANTDEALRFAKALPTRMGIVAGDYVHVWATQDCPNAYYPLVNFSARELQPFDFVTCGYSGSVFYALRPPMRNILTQQLRQALVQETRPEDLRLKNLTPEIRRVYADIYAETVVSDEDRFKDKVNAIMRFTGAKLVDLRLADGDAVVQYQVPSSTRTITSRVRVDTFQVLSAGVCLSGGDANYHLQTLIPIIEHGYREKLGDWRYG